MRGGNHALVARRGLISKLLSTARGCEGGADGRRVACAIVLEGGHQPVTLLVKERWERDERWKGIFNTRWRNLAIA
jgi:hypothetical protein